MASEISIANAALRKIGNKQKIGSFDEGTAPANFMADRYAELRDDLLRVHPWNFATKRASLAQLAAVPAIEFDHTYQLPSDWLRTIEVFDNDAGTGTVAYREENGTILCSAEAVWLRYIYQATDPNKMTADFRDLLAIKLAIEAAVDIAGSATLSDRMEKRYEEKLIEARSTDAISDRPGRLPRGSWATSRYRDGRRERSW